ncbi:ATP synthase subunit alpha [Enhygromyxa salina]|uniref:ATP synthase subunit alpha n=1 Tax=Enhygromyxa salina TaxID=215803 RepID=A0A2S9XIC0_9BACT|nr:F0F1 ATP synthase subunit alpha [Enhygromyxa salina]PRP92593.1 ATP synthase subunit alpha [Enhygromyxa salina]
MSDPGGETELEGAMRAQLERALEQTREGLAGLEPRTRIERLGRVVAVGDGVAIAHELERPVFGELVDVGGVAGRAESVSASEVRLVLLGRGSVEAGDPVRRAGRILDTPAGSGLLGRVVNPLGHPLDGRGPLAGRRRIRVERDQVPLADRELVSRPLRTGVFAIDTMIPIGRGQRQLVIGDRSTGKTELCVDILAALEPEIVGVYVAIGRRGSEIAGVVAQLREAGVLERGFCVVSDADDPLGLVHLTPYAACAMAESLVEGGRDVVIVYDDLSSHAHAHRSLALLLGRPVGREAYPVDVFYAHARLLERAAQFGAELGGGSLTALPIVETQAGDLTAYIPTNLVSITDGQIRLDAGLVAAGLNPAVDLGLSVSRVGGKAQPELVRTLAGSFKNRYAQFLELESFARFGGRLEPSAQAVIDWGRRARAALHQAYGQPRTWAQTVARMLLVDDPAFIKLSQEGVADAVDEGVARLLDDPAFDRAAIDGGRVGRELIDPLRRRAAVVAAALVERFGIDATVDRAGEEPGA